MACYLGGRAARAVSLAVVIGSLSSCAPGTPDQDSWRVDTQRSTADAASAVRTVSVTLRLRLDDRVFDRYLQTVLVDAEELAGTASTSVASTQPPAGERARYDTVTGELDEALSLLTTVRIAVVDRDADRYARFVAKLDDVSRKLTGLERDLGRPATAGR